MKQSGAFWDILLQCGIKLRRKVDPDVKKMDMRLEKQEAKAREQGYII